MSYIAALDAGTTGVRAVAVDADGVAFAQHYQEFAQHFPRPGWVEHDAVEIFRAIEAVLGRLIDELGSPPVAIGITNQRETVVAWNRRTSEPYAPAIVWQDRRGAARCDALRASHLEQVRRTTGLVLDPYFSATKLEWLFEHGSVPRGPDVAVGTIDAWLLWCLTDGAVHATEPSNASRTMLFDITELAWSEELCALFGVPMACLPEVRPTSGRFGTTRGVAGVPDGIPISGMAGDQQASLFGQACFDVGLAKNTYGTGSFVLMNVGGDLPPPIEGLLSTVAWQRAGHAPVYALEGAIFSTGSAVQWLRDGLGIIERAEELEALAASCDDTGGTFLVPAFTGLGSPWWDPYARGTIVGITRGTGRPQLARAVVEAMAFQTRDVIATMAARSSTPVEELRVDGGAAAMDLMCQFQADQLGIPVARAADLETTALGAAFLAGLAEGVWSNERELAEALPARTRFLPGDDGTSGDLAFARWHDAVERSTGWSSGERP